MMTNRTKPARLELIAREPRAEASTARTVESAPVFRGYKPKRVPPSQWELAEQPGGIDRRPRYVLRNRATDRYLLLGEVERLAWDLMEGGHSIVDIAGAVFVRFGAFDAAALQRFLAHLRSAGLLIVPWPERLREAAERLQGTWYARLVLALLRGLGACNPRLRDVDGWLGRFYAAGAWVFTTRLAVVAALALAAAGAAVYARDLAPGSRMGGALWARPGLTAFLLCLAAIPSIALHELGHALACKSYGRRVREFGFTLQHGFVPSFYADVTDIFMASRRARITVSLAGPLVNLILGALLLLTAGLAHGYARSFLVLAGVLQYASVAINLYPFTFMALDGYHVLADSLGLPTLKASACRFVRAEFVGRLRAGAAVRPHEWIYVGYVALSGVSLAVLSGALGGVVVRGFGG